MRLKSIKLAGFKSFVDPTTVSFPSNLCAVVGPNGCGKSNIIDAVRWVMGESSAKNLRGEAMTDVIFNGSGNRKPVGQASIELIFDNSSGTITGEYAGFSEISIKRRVTRDASNTYFLNGQKCRRRDITDIFLGTGLGPRSYAIIEQGMISRLIEAKPEELRVYIEEAAGISKYKERRRDTENRMRRTHENLERLTDLRDELERQLNRLERQAASAEKFTTLKKQERELRALSRALQWRTLDKQRESRARQITELELGVEAVVTEQVNLESGIEKYRVDAAELGDTFNEVQARYYGIGNDITRLEQAIQFGQERERTLRADLSAIDLERERLSESLELDKAKLEGFEMEREELAPEAEMLQETEEDSQQLLAGAEESMRVWQQRWDDFNQKAAEPRQQAEVQQSRIKYLEQVQQRLHERVTRLSAERDSVEMGDNEEEISAQQAELSELEATIEAADETLERHSDALMSAREALQRSQSERDAKRENLQLAKGRLSSLDALQTAALGSDTKAFDQWLEETGLGRHKRLAQELTVEPGWEAALEAVLGDSLQSICVESLSSEVLAHLSSLEAGNSFGKVTVVAKSESAAGDPAAISDRSTLASKVASSFAIPTVLSRVFCVEELNDAIAKRDQLADGEVFVTQQGQIVGHSWLATEEKRDAKAGVLEREREIEALSLKIESLEETLSDLDTVVEDGRQRLITLETEIQDKRRQRDNNAKILGEKRSSLSKLTAKVEQALESRRRAAADIDEAQAQMALEGENLSQARLVLEEAIAAMEGDTELRDKLMTERDGLRDKLDQARSGAKEKRERAYSAATRLSALQTQIASVKDAMTRLEDQHSRIDERRESLTEQLEASIDPSDDKENELEVLLGKRVSIEGELKTARATLEETENALREREQQRQQVQSKLGGLRENLESERLEAKTLSVQSETLRNQLVEAGFELETLIANAGENVQFEEVEDQLADTTRRIERLGAINLAAIDEFKQESERKDYLDAQDQDLREALETLENAILRIDKETRSRFKETFDYVNSGLQELFPKVFGGGSASLELTGEDLLDTGIAIMARPPGKKNSTIHLLSGGEKALTAIALVFSIFRLNPAPFCMLDEVDAPLDDANVGRYARMVEQMSDQVQFIYITHNKIAMEMAHQLMGVTMHEPGVSRMVTVDVEEAAELASA